MKWHERPENAGKMLTHASLFSGIGGAEIAAAWLGWENLFHCDINEFGRKVLGYWFPQSREYNDIKTTDFTEWRGRVDVLTAGFPCQPFSVAGKRRGADARGGLRGDVPGERRIPRFEGWEGFPTQPPVCRGDDGLPFGVADLSIPFGRWRREAIKALGNAWVPEVAYEIFRIIQLVEDGHDYD